MSDAARDIPGYKGPYNPKPQPLPDGEAFISIYNYVPSMALGVLAAALFAVGFIGHTYFWVRGRGIRWFQGLMVFGCAMEVVGYGFRIKSHKNPFLVIPFVIQYFFIVCAPVFVSAALYISLQYAINLNPANLRVSPVKKAFVAIFIVIDSVTTVIQIVGAALIGVAESKSSRRESSSITSEQANNILLAGLALQYPRATSSHHALVRDSSDLPKSDARIKESVQGTIDTDGHTYTKTFLVVLYISSFLIFLRTVYRLAETAEGVWGTASSYEWLFGLLEFAPVIVAVLMWLVRPLMVEMRRMGMRNVGQRAQTTV
ncbi:hypothetical protein QFC22_002588 [Naganishia vaughanmartiniae]|uniref:Uncharacterized protein n=1 Tax=Naganishia vaughanmartiniae TaxID=1424756 RepID=A0ACC2XA28_9TREE|nr:hypothetical protein QFC22_002588 [Naganishia vaughanmartiniae]